MRDSWLSGLATRLDPSLDDPLAKADWRDWLTHVFPGYVGREFADYHAEFWAWVWSIRPGERNAPFVAIWPRGFAKSTSTELACALAAVRGTRRYALYVCATQDQADTHVQNVAAMLESPYVVANYPEAASRKFGKYGNALGWRRNRIRTASGFTLDAIGLDAAIRGAKVDEDRPDLIVIDDIDGKLDTAAATEKKITTLTHSIIPAGADHKAILAVQNLVIENGVFAQLADGRADFLAQRFVSGPHPAIRNLVTEQRNGKTIVVSGDPTWPAMGLDACQAIIDDEGITAFLAERQHEVEAPSGGMFDHLVWRRCTWGEVPDLIETVVWVDPAVTETDQSDSNGIQADGLATDDTIYRLFSWESRSSPEDTIRRAILKAVELGAVAIGFETNQGGDLWEDTYDRIWDDLVKDEVVSQITLGDPEKGVLPTRKPEFREAKADRSQGNKAERAGHMLADYERAKIVHVIGTHETLEKALRRAFRTKPFDLTDAAVWSWKDLRSTLTGSLMA